MRAVTPEGVAAALERLYRDPDHRRALALAAYRNATRSRYAWEQIGRQWDRLFEEVMA